MHRNRILKILNESNHILSKVVIISDEEHNRITLSYNGDKIIWEWVGCGLLCPGIGGITTIHPIAAEALVDEEIHSFLRMEGVKSNEVLYVNSSGEKMNHIVLMPPTNNVDMFDIHIKKEKIKELYEKFVSDGDKLSEEIIGESISFGVLTPFLSLVNL